MATTKHEEQEARDYLKAYKEEVVTPGSLLEFRGERGNRNSTADYVEVHLYTVKEGEIRHYNLTRLCGLALGYTFRRGNTWQLMLPGGGYSKTYDVALALFRFLEVDSSTVNFDY